MSAPSVALAETQSGGPISLHRRLLWLSVLRVLMVTLLLGSAIAVNVNDVQSFADPTYLAMASMIIATYLASIVYALLIRANRGLKVLAYIQLLGDVGLSAGLIVLTGGAQSIFSFLLYLTIINAAVLLGRNGAFTMATLSSVLFVGLLLHRLGLLGFEPEEGSVLISAAPIYATTVNVVGFFLVSFLAGSLARRLAEQGTELRRRQLDIESLRRLHEDILSSISSGVVTIDHDGQLLMMNRSAAEVLGHDPSTVFGRPIVELVPELGELVPTLLAAGPDETGEWPATERWEGWISRAADGTRIYLGVSRSSLRDASGNVYGHILGMKDLTQIREMERRIQQRDRLAAVGQLATAIAHEIRNPLASISGSVEMLQELAEPEDDRRSLMDIVLREIGRLNALIADFLDYAGPRRERREHVPLGPIVEETIELCRFDAGLMREARLVAELNDLDYAIVLGDERALRQIVWNLIRNAAEALDGRGEIRVSTQRVSRARNPRWRGAQGGDLIELTVADTGPGIAPDVIDRIFQPFFTTRSRGTGLGLATVHRIVEDHGGQIDVSSEVGQGATFVVQLPLEALDRVVSQVDAPVPVRGTVESAEPPGWK